MLQFGSLYKVRWEQGLDHWQLKRETEQRTSQPITVVNHDLMKRQAYWAVDDAKGKHATRFQKLQNKQDKVNRLDHLDLKNPRLRDLPGAILAALFEGLSEAAFTLRPTGRKSFVVDGDSFREV